MIVKPCFVFWPAYVAGMMQIPYRILFDVAECPLKYFLDHCCADLRIFPAALWFLLLLDLST